MTSTYVESLVDVEISVHVPLMSLPNRASHAWPWLLDCQNAFNVISLNFLASDWIYNCWFDAKERERGAAGFRRSNSTKRGDDMGAGFRLPIRLEKEINSTVIRREGEVTYINNMSFLFTNYFKVPFPHFGRYGLTNRP